MSSMHQRIISIENDMELKKLMNVDTIKLVGESQKLKDQVEQGSRNQGII